MKYDELLQQMESDPRFAKLGYQDQVAVRAQVFAKKLSEDPDFVKLPKQSQDIVWQRILYRKPVYSDPQYAAYTDALEQGIKNGNKQALYTAMDDVASQKASDEFAITRFVEGIVTKVGQALEPIYKKIDPAHTIHVPSQDDKRKMATYFDRLINKERATTERASLALRLFPVEKGIVMGAAGAAGLAPFYASLVGTLAEPVGLAKLGTKAIDLAGEKLIKHGFGMAVAKASKVLVHSVAGGVVGMINEGLKNAMEQNWNNPNLVEVEQAALKGFKPYFIGDLAMFAVGGLLKGMGIGARKVFSKGFIKEGSKTVDEYSKAVTDALTGKIDPVMFNRLRPEQQAILLKVQKFNGILKHVDKQTPDNLLEMVGFSNGLDINIKNGKYTIKKVGEEATHTFSSFNDAVKFTRNFITKETPVKLTQVDKAVLGSGSKTVKLETAIKGTIPKSELGNTALLAKLASSNKGIYSPMRVKTFSDAVLKNLDVPDDIVKSLKVQTIGDKIQVFAGDKHIGDVPKIVSNSSEELSTIQKLIKGLKELAPEKAQGKAVITNPEILKEAQRAQNYTLPLLDNLAQKKLGMQLVRTNNTFQLIDKANPKNTISFKNFTEAGNYILRNGIDEHTLRLHLKYNEGLNLVKDAKTNELRLRKHGKTIATYKDIDSLLADKPEFTPKISPNYGPSVALVNDTNEQVVYGRDTIEGTYQDVLKTLNKFEDYSKKANTIKLGTTKKATIEVNPTEKLVTLDIPEIEYKKTFKSIKEAKKFLESGWAEHENLDAIAADKGFRVEVSGGKYFIYGEKNQAFMAETKKELQQILKEAPSPSWAPEYSGLSEDIINTFEKPPEGMFKPVEFTVKREGLSPVTTISHTYRPPDAWFVKVVEQGGDANILKYFRQLDSTMQFLTAEEGKVAKELVGVWKGYKRKARVKIGELLEIPEEEWVSAAAERGLNAKDVAVAKAMRKFFDAAGQRFQVGYNKLIDDYLPRMRKTYLKDPAKYRSDSSMAEFIQDSFGGRVPKDLDAFFKHQRVSDVVRFVREDDPLTLALKYNAIGQRETFLGPLWKEIDGYLKANGNTIDPILKMRFQAYQADLMGIPSGMGEKALVEFSKRFYKGLKGANVTPGLASDLTKAMMSWGYLSAMGFRIWLPIRNMFQVWTTLAPRVGNSWVSEAINVVSKDKSGKIFAMLKQRGIFSENLPLYGSNIIEGEQALSRLLHKGLKWYKNSDEWTRAVAYTASQLRFKDAVKRFSKGLIKENNFIELSGLGMMPTDLKNEALGFIRQGKWANAEDTFARMITSDTMFSYRAGMAPTSFRGAVGKLFGMMGHYPVYYLENVKRALKYSTLGQKIAYGTRFVGNSLALYYAFHNVLGINATNFLPWTPSMFSGGPYYQLMNEAFLSAGKGYQAREARAKLFGIKHENGHLKFDPTKAEVTRWGIPFGFLTHNVVKGIKHLDANEPWLAFLSFTTAPINPDLLQK